MSRILKNGFVHVNLRDVGKVMKFSVVERKTPIISDSDGDRLRGQLALIVQTLSDVGVQGLPDIDYDIRERVYRGLVRYSVPASILLEANSDKKTDKA